MTGEQATTDDQPERRTGGRGQAAHRPRRAATATPASMTSVRPRHRGVLTLAARRRRNERVGQEAFSAARIRASARLTRSAPSLGVRSRPAPPRAPPAPPPTSISSDSAAYCDRIETRLLATERNPPSTAANEPLAVDRLDLDDAVDQQREHRHVVAQYADVALGRLRDDHRGLTGPHGPVGRDELDLQLVAVRHQRFFWISAHFFSTSSRPPHMKKACSATWS